MRRSLDSKIRCEESRAPRRASRFSHWHSSRHDRARPHPVRVLFACCQGERLKQISIDSAIEHTRGVFDDLLAAIYSEVETQAERGKRVVVIGFLQEKLVKGVRYSSQKSDFWEAKFFNPHYHRFLSSIPNQQLLCDRLAEQGLKAHVKPLSVNVPVGDEAVAMQWVSTTTLLLTLTIWEPTQVYMAQGGRASEGGEGSGGGAEAGSGLRPPMLMRSASDMRSTDEWSLADASSPEHQLSTVHRVNLNTAWGRPATVPEEIG